MVEGHPPDSLRVVRERRCAVSLLLTGTYTHPSHNKNEPKLFSGANQSIGEMSTWYSTEELL